MPIIMCILIFFPIQNTIELNLGYSFEDVISSSYGLQDIEDKSYSLQDAVYKSYNFQETFNMSYSFQGTMSKNEERTARDLRNLLKRCLSSAARKRDEQIPEDMLNFTNYDFIIVGAGSAGSVLANRLSEHSEWKVLLLEAGEEPISLMDIAVIPAIWQYTNYNWNYLMEPQKNLCQGLEDQLMAWPRGKGIGGSSLINFMIHVRGNRLDYDKWAAMGNPGWSYEELLPYFKKSEDCQVKFKDEGYHQRGGLLTTQDVSYRTKISQVFLHAGKELGYDILDYNGRDQMGFSHVQATTRNGLRCSTEKAFVRPAKTRPNLTILNKSLVTKVLLDNQNRAYGVQFQRNGKVYEAYAEKEVVLSAGAFHSPQILMLSGIGPKEHLFELGIPLVQDLPVGEKMYDHLAYLGLVFPITRPISLMLGDWINPVSAFSLLAKGTGPLTTLSAVEAIAFLKTNQTNDQLPTYPDIELLFIGGGFHTDFGILFRKVFRISDEVYRKIWKPIENRHAWSVFPILIHPKSYGKVRLRSRDPLDSPKLYGNYFTDRNQDDIKTFIAGIRFVQQLAKTSAFQSVGTREVEVPIPNCRNFIYDSDAYWECAVRSVSATLHHQVSTCKMGPADDPESVVDSKLRVYGVSNLRVADLSVVPLPLSAHTNVPAVMIGEKASDLIAYDWLRK